MQIRCAVLGDVAALAQVHVASWQTTYAGLLPADVIAEYTMARRQRQWHAIITAGVEAVFVATDASGALLGFASGGACRDATDAQTYAGELSAIYLVQAAQRQGTGLALVKAVATWLAAQGMTSMLVWVLRENPARRFYEALGGQFVREKDETRGSVTLHEVAYGWRDTHDLTTTADDMC